MNITSAKKASEFVEISKADRRGRVIRALVPGHNGVLYKVYFKRGTKGKEPFISTICETVDGEPCKGNSNSICYHTLAAIIAGAKKLKSQVYFCNEREDALKLNNLVGSGQPYILESSQSDKSVWLFVKVNAEASILC